MSAVTDRLIPYITAREGEEADSALTLRARFGYDGVPQLAYWDEGPGDRDPHGVLWARCSQSIGPDRLPQGAPQWRLVHPSRQRETMMKLLCQLCVGPTRNADGGRLFLESASAADLSPGAPVRTAQPPVCLQHARLAVTRCPRLARGGYVALMTRKCPLFGVIGTPYEYGPDGLEALPGNDRPLPYGDPRLRWFLASQLVRELRDYAVVDLNDLEPAA